MRFALTLLLALLPLAGQDLAARRQDLQFVLTEVPRRHPNFFTQMTRAQFDNAGRALDAALPSLSNEVFYTRLASLIAAGKDAHTFLSLSGPAGLALGFRALPVSFGIFDDGIFVVSALPELGPLPKAKLLRVGGVSIEQAIERFRQVIATENEPWFRYLLPGYLRNLGVLRGLELAPADGPATYTLQLPTGETSDVEMSPTAGGLVGARPQPGFTGVFQRNNSENYWTEYWPENRAIYVAYRVCQESAAKPIAQFAREIGELARQPVDTMIFDLRGNTGGNSIFFSRLVDALGQTISDQVLANRRFRAFALIDGGTFSSGMNAVFDLKRPLNLPPGFGPEDGSPVVTILGTATGGRPGGYGEVLPLQLPGSGLSMQYSTRLMTVPTYIPRLESIFPEVRVTDRATDYFTRHDAYLAAALARIANPPPNAVGDIIVVNGASFRLETGIAPGSFATAFGRFQGTNTLTVNGIPAAILAASPSQIVFRVPVNTALGSAVVESSGLRGTFPVRAAGPGLFVAEPANLAQPGAVLNQDSRLHTELQAARAGEVLQLFGTGYPSNHQAAVWIGQQPAEVLFSGMAPGVPGLWQVNARIPATLGPGPQPLFLASGDSVSNGVTVWLR
ncbi:MAG: hypothetical protein K2X03_25835 [Bryobacteraceae bacterium]|nr:hypothetical protein [Bryobacteraceae bacterium]